MKTKKLENAISILQKYKQWGIFYGFDVSVIYVKPKCTIGDNLPDTKHKSHGGCTVSWKQTESSF